MPWQQRLIDFLLGHQNAGPLLDTVRDGFWLFVAALVLRVFSFAIELVLGPSSLIETVHEGLVYAAVVGLACRTLKRIFDWIRKGDY